MSVASQPFDAATMPLDGLRLIEASAGTGKTFSLAGLYLRLIVERDVSVRDILVMTFTRAATQELRERIRTRLTDAARIAADASRAEIGNPEHDFTPKLIRASAEDAPLLASRLAEAAARIDEATITTIHGFAQRAATENAFDSAIAFDRGEATDDPPLWREAAADYWRSCVFGKSDDNARLRRVWPTPDALYETLAPLLGRPHARLAGNAGKGSTALLTKKAVQEWKKDYEALLKVFHEALDAGALFKNEPLNQALIADDALDERLAALGEQIATAHDAGQPPILPTWLRRLAEPHDQFKKAAKHQALAEELSAIPLCGTLAALQTAAERELIAQALTAVRSLADRRKRARRLYSFDDMIRALHDALTDADTGDALAAALHARWPYALVDEFQDTDPLQYDSFQRIYNDRDHGALILIGDPKQAIYAFRGGDVHAYLRAADDARGNAYTLTTNYRSTQPVLDAIAALYDVDNPFLVDGIDFPKIKAGRTSGDQRLLIDGEEMAALTFWNLAGGKGTKGEDRPALIDKTVASIGQLLDGTSACWVDADNDRLPVVASDIAILVNSHREAAALQSALAYQGIMAVCQHRSSIFESAEADELRFILRALAAPDDAMAVRAAQPTALLGQHLADFIEMADDDRRMHAEIERFQALYLAWQRRGLLAALNTLLVAAAPRLLSLADGERRMSNYLQLAELLAEAETECFGMASLIRWLDIQIEQADQPGASAEESQLRLESDEALVRIATVHAAKGLEYPIVFMPFGLWLGQSNQFTDPKKPPLFYHDDGHAYVDVLGESGNSGPRVDKAIAEHRAESLRVLYVALTRARQACIVGWRDNADGALANLFKRGSKPAGNPSVVFESVNVEKAIPPGPRLAADHPAFGAPRTDVPAKRRHWSSYSFSRLAHARIDDIPVPGAEDELATTPDVADYAPSTESKPVIALDDQLRGVNFGSAVHAILEKQNQRNQQTRDEWPKPGAAMNAAQRKHVAQTLRRYGLIDTAEDDDTRIEQTGALVSRTLHTPLPGIGKLVDINAKQTLHEMGFLLSLGGTRLEAIVACLRDAGYLQTPIGGHAQQILYGLMQGFIDLIIEADGRYIVIDYKTNHLGDHTDAYRGAALQQAVSQSHYDLQYLIYTVALHRHLKQCLPGYDPARHLGGVQYLFVRAMDGVSDAGVFTDRPDADLIGELDALFDGVPKKSGIHA